MTRRLDPTAVLRGPADVAALAGGLLIVLVAALASAVVPHAAVPVAAVLLGTVAASSVGSTGVVAIVAFVATAAAALVAHGQGYAGTAWWARLATVGVVSAATVAAARVRTRHERQIAHALMRERAHDTLQRTLLPKPVSTAQVQVRAEYQPGETDLVVCGDFIDAVPFGDSGAVAFCVGDVTGHDAVAAGVASSLRAAWRVLALSGGSPGEWLVALDRLMRFKALEDRMATACVGILDPSTRRLVIATAGHPRPILLDDVPTLLEIEAGPPLGLPLDFEPTWREEPFGLDRDFGLLLYTDGLIEGRRAPGSTARYGEESLAAWLHGEVAPAHALSEAHLDKLFADIARANGGPLADDVTVMLLVGGGGATATPAEIRLDANERADRPS